MVAGFDLFADSAFHPTDRAVENRHAGVESRMPSDTLEPSLRQNSKSIRQGLLFFGEETQPIELARLKVGHDGTVQIDAHENQRRVSGYGGKGVDRKTVRLAKRIKHGRHCDTCCEPGTGTTEGFSRNRRS